MYSTWLYELYRQANDKLKPNQQEYTEMINKNNDIPLPIEKNLPISEIQTDPDNFQRRHGELNSKQVRDLQTIIDRGQMLTPILVWRNTEGENIVLGGHHRLAAYEAAAWSGVVPVLLFECSLELAWVIAADDNSRTQVPLTSAERGNTAWFFTVKQHGAKADVSRWSGVGTSTVAEMRRVWKKLVEAGVEIPETWRAAQRVASGGDEKEWTDDDREAYHKIQVSKLRDQIGDAVAIMASRNIDVVADALDEILGGRFASVADRLGYDPAFRLAEDEIPF